MFTLGELSHRQKGGRIVPVLVGLSCDLGNLSSIICSAADFLYVFQKIPVPCGDSVSCVVAYILILALLPMGPMSLSLFKGRGTLKYPGNKMQR